MKLFFIHFCCCGVQNKVKSMNGKVFNLMAGVNGTRLVQHKSCKYKSGLNERICKSKQKWKDNECCCECKELDDWSSSKSHYPWSFENFILVN